MHTYRPSFAAFPYTRPVAARGSCCRGHFTAASLSPVHDPRDTPLLHGLFRRRQKSLLLRSPPPTSTTLPFFLPTTVQFRYTGQSQLGILRTLTDRCLLVSESPARPPRGCRPPLTASLRRKPTPPRLHRLQHTPQIRSLLLIPPQIHLLLH